MKKQLFLIVCLLVSIHQSKSQVTTANNNVGTYTGQYVGWDASMTGNPLVIKHVANQDMEFYTNNTQRMTLQNTGELGLGTTSPSAWFHILTNGSGTVASSEVFRTVVPGSTASYWRMYRGSDKMADLFFGSTANAFNIHATRGPLHLHSGSTGGADIEAFEIVGGTGSDAGFVGLGDWDNFDPNTNLHIHQSSSSGVGIQMTNSTSGTGQQTDGKCC